VTLLGLGIVVPEEVAAELKATGARPAIFGEGSTRCETGRWYLPVGYHNCKQCKVRGESREMGGNRRMLKEALKLLGTIQLSSRIGCPTVNLIRRVYYPMVNTKSQRHHYFSDHRHLV